MTRGLITFIILSAVAWVLWMTWEWLRKPRKRGGRK